MKETADSLVACFAMLILATTTMAQPRGGEGPGGRGERGFGGPPPSRILEALDSNGDYRLSAKEIAGAVASLKKLDQNSDGKLSNNELDSFRGRGGSRGGPGGFGPGGGDRGFRGGPGGGPPSADDFVERAMGFDEDKDGKLSTDELLKAAEVFGRGRGRGGPGGLDGGRGEVGGRPQRPARPDSN